VPQNSRQIYATASHHHHHQQQQSVTAGDSSDRSSAHPSWHIAASGSSRLPAPFSGDLSGQITSSQINANEFRVSTCDMVMNFSDWEDASLYVNPNHNLSPSLNA